MPGVTISCLIYRSREYADFIERSVAKYTHEPHTFRFIILDPEEDFRSYMAARGHITVIRSGQEDKEPLDYLKRVYAAYNSAVRRSAEIAVLVQSDNFVSPGWLTGLLEHLDRNTIVTPTLIERGKIQDDEIIGNHGMTGMPEKDFGTPLVGFDENAWIEHARLKAEAGAYENAGPYMPLAVYRDTFRRHGGFPIGNQDGVPADVIFFEKLKTNGVRHIVSRSSVVYHVGEGEKRLA